ncbi:MAG: hypothetical protein HYR91_15500 [Flavobacteriia bacterium]|nr:hypothetical protein [Flavobacteriia bacterium]
MIKIEIENIEDKKDEYISKIIDPVKSRISALILSIDHLLGNSVDVNHVDFNACRTVTKLICKEFSSLKINDYKTFLNDYENTVKQIISDPNFGNDFRNIKLKDLLLFLNYLMENDAFELKELLVCNASELKTKNDDFLSDYNIDGNENKKVLKLAFNYEKYDNVTKEIKDFFRSNNFIDYCPYCNYTKVRFIKTDGGRTASTHQLDHFFDKASFPLLCYSFFNLIPSDSTCNGSSNKGKIEFTDEFHLNPYTGGFCEFMAFKPNLVGTKVENIELEILAPLGSLIRKQMLGSTEQLNEDNKGDKEHEQGNINVFTLFSKYKEEIEVAQNVLDTIYRADSGLKPLKKFLNLMPEINKKETYKSWYKDSINTYFDDKFFGKEGKSKFKRDIHDYYYLTLNNKRRNKYVRDLIKGEL